MFFPWIILGNVSYIKFIIGIQAPMPRETSTGIKLTLEFHLCPFSENLFLLLLHKLYFKF